MIKLLTKLLGAVLANAVAVLAAAYFVPEFQITPDVRTLLQIALILTVLNLFLRPLMKLFFAPFIVLTLGFGLIAINAVVLLVLDRLSESLTIQGILPLLYATLIISLVNFVLHIFFKSK